MDAPLVLDAAAVERVTTPAQAVAALRDALLAGGDPASGPPRTAVALAAGQLLLMPATSAVHAGVKLVTVATDPPPDRPRVAGLYVLFDAVGLHPVAVLDGAALTTLRTAAVSALAADRLATEGTQRLLVFGTGPQGWGHVQALRAVRPLREVVVVGRDPARRSAFVQRVRSSGLACRPGSVDDVEAADLVVCATTARRPLFDSGRVRSDACVLAVGSHEPQVRELDGALLARASTVAVEDPATALREAGDVVLAVAEGALAASSLVGLTELVAGPPRPAGQGPTVFKSVGMGWEDLAVAGLVVRRAAQPWTPSGR